MTRDQAINYLYSSGMSDEQVKTVVEALSQADEDAISRQAMLEGDLISRLGALELFTWNNTKEDIWYGLKLLPSVAIPNKTGHWIWQTENIYRCSECGEDIFVKEVMNVPQYKCCPMCMTKMIDKQESEDKK